MAFDYGRTYIFVDPLMERGFHCAKDFFLSGSAVLSVSRMHPDLLRERWGGKCPESIWLSERAGEKNLSPIRMSHLVQRMSAFAQENPHAVILLDGLEYLALFHDFLQVQMFMEHINDVAMETGAIFLMVVDPRSFDQRSLARLKRFAEVVE